MTRAFKSTNQPFFRPTYILNHAILLLQWNIPVSCASDIAELADVGTILPDQRRPNAHVSRYALGTDLRGQRCRWDLRVSTPGQRRACLARVAIPQQIGRAQHH